MNDLKIYKKAARNVKASLVLFYVLFMAIAAGTWFLLNIDLFAINDPSFDSKLLLVSGIQALVLLFLFWLLSKGTKISRILYWLGILANCALLYLPFTAYMEDRSRIYTWLAWAACLVIEDVLLYNVGVYLFQNNSCKIFYEHVIEIDEDDADLLEEYRQDQQEQPDDAANEPNYVKTPPIPKTPNANPSQYTSQRYRAADWEPKKKKLSFKAKMQRLSVKLGICVYGELILFPIIVSMFSDYFASTDMKNVFATRDIFILCISSAMIWTVAIFFLYYAPYQAKKIIWACWGAEALVNLWYIPKFYAYYTSSLPSYPLQVFLFFIVLDVIRYAMILMVLMPAMTARKETVN